MKKRSDLIRTKQQKFSGNESGFLPLDTKVLVLPDTIDDTSEGGIVLTSDTIKQNDLAVTEGYLVDIGNAAFNDYSSEDSDLEVMMPGARVVWAIYAGQMLEGEDGKMYRLINDTDLAAIRG